MADSTFIKRVVLKNYRSIASCDVRLGPLCFLVGPNGAGKSNFLDALGFISDSLNTTLDKASQDRGGIEDIIHRSAGASSNFSIELEFIFSGGVEARYDLGIGVNAQGGPKVQYEKLATLRTPLGNIHYQIRDGAIEQSSLHPSPPASDDRLYLVQASGWPVFREAFDLLKTMCFYNLNLDKLRDTQKRSLSEVLNHDGGNLTSILRRLQDQHPLILQRVEEYLATMVPGFGSVEVTKLGGKEVLEFKQKFDIEKPPWRFQTEGISDGTLRALGNLVAIFQVGNGSAKHPSLVGIEEPETALHPAAAGVLRDALRQASRHTQVLVTSHSPDLLDDDSIPDDQILAVVAEEGKTIIDRINDAGRSVLRDRLYTAGELLRLDQLRPVQPKSSAETKGA
jgi:predicted ATPase